MRRAWFAAAVAVLISLRADPPELNAFYPVGAALGTTMGVTISGKTEPWPPKFWSDPPGLIFTPTTNKNKVLFEIPNNIAPGPRLIRIYNSDGISDARFFVAGQGRELIDTEPNNRASEAQDPGALPVTISGRLDKNDDVDDFKGDF